MPSLSAARGPTGPSIRAWCPHGKNSHNFYYFLAGHLFFNFYFILLLQPPVVLMQEKFIPITVGARVSALVGAFGLLNPGQKRRKRLRIEGTVVAEVGHHHWEVLFDDGAKHTLKSKEKGMKMILADVPQTRRTRVVTPSVTTTSSSAPSTTTTSSSASSSSSSSPSLSSPPSPSSPSDLAFALGSLVLDEVIVSDAGQEVRVDAQECEECWRAVTDQGESFLPDNLFDLAADGDVTTGAFDAKALIDEVHAGRREDADRKVADRKGEKVTVNGVEWTVISESAQVRFYPLIKFNLFIFSFSYSLEKQYYTYY